MNDEPFANVGARLPRNTTHIHLPSVGSTNALSLDRAASEPIDWITADVQTEGRGRRGRAWASPPGNLYASALHEPSSDASTPLLPLTAALALYDAVSTCAPDVATRLALKWPNDLLLDGRKVAGILLEARFVADRRVVAIGFGVNCSAHPADAPFPATDFRTAGFDVAADRLFVALAAALNARLAREGANDYLATTIADWRARAHGIGQDITVRLPTRELHGTFADLAPDGRLVLHMNDGRTERIAAGDVFFDPSQGHDMNTHNQHSEAHA